MTVHRKDLQTFIPQAARPFTPAAGHVGIFSRSADGRMIRVDDAGVETLIGFGPWDATDNYYVDALGEIPGSYSLIEDAVAAVAVGGTGRIFIVRDHLELASGPIAIADKGIDLFIPMGTLVTMGGGGPGPYDPRFNVTGSGFLGIYGGAIFNTSGFNTRLIAINTTGGLEVDSCFLFQISIPATFYMIDVTAFGQIRITNSSLIAQGFAGGIDFNAVASIDPGASWIRNTLIQTTGAASTADGITHDTGLANFPLYNSTIRNMANSLTNITLEVGNASNFIA